MASDLTNILKSELSNTIEQLLSKKATIKSINKFDISEFSESQAVLIGAKLEFQNISSSWTFIIPTSSGVKFEYLMLGGMGDLKENLDDEISDAIKEIISNVCGSMSTSINAQGFDDLGKVKTEVTTVSIVEANELKTFQNSYKFTLDLEGDELFIVISFDDIIKPYISSITGEVPPAQSDTSTATKTSENGKSTAVGIASHTNGNSDISSILNEHSITNLKLLFDIKLKLSVRLGTKVLLLKDILRWDVGEIIELEQMVNEPLDILVNGVKVGEGEAVVVEGKFGLKVRYIGDAKNRLKKLGLV
ncbi:FliM/FliN family flagellar motor switch protein [Arcobacter sp. FWKO B]|uniref:FliM/FliN family flagellar motor switch protein n=1 Tax=Arcobacter sp. FWKO B TaxID=2593672 RepID=UPI0018A5E964|nr:FliM/FliN family flagellar motor switch protein [Arcobacter sp. FWKO B]QOG12015.1 flagellar motor switch protein FliY [Arcobacter sp. FWKO B]